MSYITRIRIKATTYGLMIGTGLILILVAGDLADIVFQSFVASVSLKIVGGVASLFGFVGLLASYLSGDLGLLSRDSKYKYSSDFEYEIDALSSKIREMQESFTGLLETSSSSTKTIDMDSLAESIRKEAISSLPEKVVAELEGKFSTKSIDNSQIALIRDDLSKTSTRLQKETGDLGRKATQTC